MAVGPIRHTEDERRPNDERTLKLMVDEVEDLIDAALEEKYEFGSGEQFVYEYDRVVPLSPTFCNDLESRYQQVGWKEVSVKSTSNSTVIALEP